MSDLRIERIKETVKRLLADRDEDTETEVEEWALETVPALVAEIERLRASMLNFEASTEGIMAAWKTRAEKAEAEVERLRSRIKALEEMCDEKAALARKVVEAVTSDDNVGGVFEESQGICNFGCNGPSGAHSEGCVWSELEALAGVRRNVDTL